jgi:hypothetical protein
MPSFRIYSNRQKVINKHEIINIPFYVQPSEENIEIGNTPLINQCDIKIINFPFDIQPSEENIEIGNVPLNICILGVTATINNNDVDFTYDINILTSLRNNNNTEYPIINCRSLNILKGTNKGSGFFLNNINCYSQTAVSIRPFKNNMNIPLTGVVTFHYYQM